MAFGMGGRGLGAVGALAGAFWLVASAATGQVTPAVALADAVAEACGRVTTAEMAGGSGPNAVACRVAVTEAYNAAAGMGVPDQEVIGFGLVRALEAVAPDPNVPFPAVVITFASQSQGALQDRCFTGGRPAVPATVETCSAIVRVVGVLAQALSPDILAVLGSDICGWIVDTPAWRPALTGIVAELAARAATGTDPIMRAGIDPLVAAIAACPGA